MKAITRANVTVIDLTNGRRICLSYGVPVAAFIPGRGYLKTARRYSVTTSKHANAFAGKDATEVSDSEFRALIEPLTLEQGA